MKFASYKKVLVAVMAISVTTVSGVSVPIMAADIEAAEDEVSLEDEASVENEVPVDEELNLEDEEMSVTDETENPDLKSEEQNSDADELEITSDEEGTQDTLSEEIQEDMFSEGTAEEAAQSAVRSTVYKLGTKVTASWQQGDGIIEYFYTPAKTGYYQIQGESDRIYDTEIFEGTEKIIDYKFEDKEYTWNLDEDDMIKVFLKKGQKYTIRFIVPGEDKIFEEDEYLHFSMRLQQEILNAENVILIGNNWYLDNKGVLTIWKDNERDPGTNIQWEALLKKKNTVKKIIFIEGITRADVDCANFQELTTVNFSSTVKTISGNFRGCKKLTTVNIPNNSELMSIGENSFEGTAWYNSLQGSYKILGGVLFEYTGNETEMKIPETIHEIGGSILFHNKTVKKLIIPGTIKTIGFHRAFDDCSALETIILKEGVEVLTEQCFLDCNNLKEITIPKSVKEIGWHAIGYHGTQSLWGEIESERNSADNLPTINCYTNSAAHKYAVENSIPFRLLDAAKKTVTVKFNANGGKVSKISIKVTSGKQYRSLPKATRSGYTFLGWYTTKSGGTLVTKNSYVNNTKTHTLYARWKSNKVAVTFNANGGKVTKTSSIVTKGKKYGTLPKATRSGYSFQGWYTAKTGGKKVTESTTVNVYGKQTLYARWKSDKVTVTFNANGGKVMKTSATVTKGKKYGTLPKATKKGYKFQGWYTAKTGGKKVTAATIVNVYGKHTLYARWKK